MNLRKLPPKLYRLIRPTQWCKLEDNLAICAKAYLTDLKGQIPHLLIETLVLGEDHRFYRHPGVDPVAITGAVWRLIQSGRISGASTIEQQLVRVLTGDRRRTIGRKVNEMILACMLDALFDKTNIAGMYMTVAYFGWQMNGLQEACCRMNIDVHAMTALEAAGLVARLKYPEPQCPSVRKIALIARRTEYLLSLMKMDRTPIGEKLSSHAAYLDT